ncbi:MAG TPA: hypothetical protein PLJ60_04810 [Chryseolinea sp.]|nr:hypothetical protein [Chryseolinea sp.]HPM29638.1 hypothetical protein [Chryseolinea sp.]
MKRSLFGLLLLISFTLQAQVYSNKEVGKKNAVAIDSLKNSEYPYVLPILGAKATKAGFQLPYSAGLSVQYIWQKSDLVIDNLQVGFNNGPLHSLDEVVRFKNAQSEAMGVNFRPDIWLFPFLNVYGIIAKSAPSTAIDAGIYVPDQDGNWSEVIALNTKADFQATSLGFGLTPTVGVAGGFLALDFNCTWNDIAELDKPAFAFIFGPRFGKTFKLKKPNSAIALWVGGFRLKLNSGTTGSMNFDDLFDTSGLQGKVDNGIAAVGNKQEAVDTWWSDLSNIEQNNPVNIAKYERANSALARAGTFLNSMDEALNDEESASVQYSLDKRPKDMWNFVVGTQYQYNKHWMLRLEVGMLGSRQQVIGGLQYRFGL